MEYIDLNARQAAILDFIKQEIQDKGYPPAVREICEAVGLNSPSTVHAHLHTLELKGYIRRDPMKPRALEVLGGNAALPSSSFSSREMVEVPLLGRISAGQPAFAEENVEDTFPIPLDFLNSNKQLFMLRVHGESMIEVGIENGDLLIVEHADTARNGEIVVALIDDEATVKTFYREINRYRLQPENHSMQPIYTDHCTIIGKPIGLFRRF
ncbi:MAG: transcriptional repressor LexA [Bacillota bacterium]|nr:transcriptional repressor LexA [Bacillota bacterium]